MASHLKMKRRKEILLEKKSQNDNEDDVNSMRLTSMDDLMFHKICGLRETLVTYFTCMWFFTWMNEHMLEKWKRNRFIQSESCIRLLYGRKFVHQPITKQLSDYLPDVNSLVEWRISRICSTCTHVLRCDTFCVSTNCCAC